MAYTRRPPVGPLVVPEPVLDTAPCFYCAGLVRLPEPGAVTTPIESTGYTGLDAYGRLVCPDCHCPTCGLGHELLVWAVACAGAYRSDCRDDVDLGAERYCDPDAAHELAAGK